MRATSVLNRFLSMPGVFVRTFSFEPEGLVLHVRPRRRRPRCSGCGRKAPRVDVIAPCRRWRHLPFGATAVWLECPSWRVRCGRCGLRVEEFPWSKGLRGGFTYPFAQIVAYLAQRMSHRSIAEMMHITWGTVGVLASRVAQDLLPADRYEGLRRIGVDEFCWARPRGFLTVVWDHDRRRIVWVGEGRGSDTLQGFFRELGAERAASIEIVTGDMGAGFLKAIREALPNAQTVLDPFHVLRLAHDAVDQVRRRVVRELREENDERAQWLKHLRFVLLRHGGTLLAEERARLATVARVCRPLHRAWTLKEMLGYVLERRSLSTARSAFGALVARMARSRLRPFIRLGRTLRLHADAILASIRYRISNGPIEGANRKIRGLIYRAFGYRSLPNLVAAIHLNCSGIQVPNPLGAST
jgi:transposase